MGTSADTSDMVPKLKKGYLQSNEQQIIAGLNTLLLGALLSPMSAGNTDAESLFLL